MDNKKYSLMMMNRNGYTIKKEGNTIETLKNYARNFPLESFFAWIYDKRNDNMICQNEYNKRFHKCNNDTFKPYWA